jgi:hypothetical protein
MKCCICQKGLDDVGVLYRINAKGVPGIYACRQHMSQTDAAAPDAEVAEIASILGATPAGKGEQG